MANAFILSVISSAGCDSLKRSEKEEMVPVYSYDDQSTRSKLPAEGTVVSVPDFRILGSLRYPRPIINFPSS
jgi:hypothetical protein